MTDENERDPKMGERTRHRIEAVILVVGLALIVFFVVAASSYRPTRPLWSGEEQEARAALRRIHAAQLGYFRSHRMYAPDLRELNLPLASEHFNYVIVATRPAAEFSAYATWREAGRGQFLRIDDDGWITAVQPSPRRLTPAPGAPGSALPAPMRPPAR
jgi:hypothetical protein